MSKDKKPLSKEERMAALEGNLPTEVKAEVATRDEEQRIAIIEKLTLQLKNDPFDTDIVLDTDADTEFARDTIKGLIDGSKSTMENLKTFADDVESPRGYEVLATMMNTIANLSKDLIDIQRVRKEVRKSRIKEHPKLVGSDGEGNVNVFVGTTTELQKRMKEVRDAEETTIDV